jgi:hypothetical protein
MGQYAKSQLLEACFTIWVTLLYGIQQPTVVHRPKSLFRFQATVVKVNRAWKSMCNVFV